jgi:16S rRNA (cytosine967-C5)-methyltransferase
MKRDVKPGFEARSNRPIGGRDGWEAAVGLVERWLATNERVDALLEQLAPVLPPQERARAQHLFFGVVRWASSLEAALDGLMTRPPRTKVTAILMLAGFEMLETPSVDAEAAGEGLAAKIVHHAVEKAKTVASAKEAGLINAVARKLAARLGERAAAQPVRTPVALAKTWAHPLWLVQRWLKEFGIEATEKFLEWNQTPAPVYARWRAAGVSPPDFLAPTRWSGFFSISAGRWDEVRRLAAEGALYLQDPSTRLCLELLAPQANETILDACAAPGGKSLFIADLMAARWSDLTTSRSERVGDNALHQAGRVVALDEEGPRLTRLRENLGRAPKTVEVALMPGDLRKAGPSFFEGFNLPASYDAVLLDAPCSNTGVMRHRIDVKWRLQEGDFDQHAAQQFTLLRAAARLVRDGGRLVYSTCSIDAVENEQVAQRFAREARGWKLERHVQAYPWIDGHDGAAAFLLRKA